MWRLALFALSSIFACSSEPAPGASDTPEGTEQGDGTAGLGAGGSAPVASIAGRGGGGGSGGGAAGTTPPGPTEQPACTAGRRRCGADCVDVLSDLAHCGGCDAACETDMECSSGTCIVPCDTRVDCAVGEACLADGCENPSLDKAFQDEESRDSAYGTSPQVDVAATGHAAIVWDATNTSELLVSRYILAQDAWTAPLPIHEPMAPFPGSPHIAVDDAGNAIAVWHQGGNDFRDGWANRYDAALNMWLGPQRIEPEADGFADVLRVVLDAVGNATVVWPYYKDGVGGTARAIRYDAASQSWGSQVDLSPQVMTGAGNVTAAADLRGNVMAAWEQSPPGMEFGDLRVARYDVESGSWSAPVAIDAHDLGHVNHPNVTADGDGNFFVAWHQTGEEVVHVWVNRYDAASGEWGTAEKLDTATGSNGALWGRLGADHHGHCLAVWEQDSVLTSALYEPESGAWSMLGPVDASSDFADPELVVDRGGNGIAIFRGSSSRIYVSRFDPTTRSWSAREPIDPVHADRTSEPNIDIDAQGRATATWHETGASGSWEVMTNRFQ